jgi:hypothetical protein
MLKHCLFFGITTCLIRGAHLPIPNLNHDPPLCIVEDAIGYFVFDHFILLDNHVMWCTLIQVNLGLDHILYTLKLLQCDEILACNSYMFVQQYTCV